MTDFKSWSSPYSVFVRNTDPALSDRIATITLQKQRELAERTRARVAQLRTPLAADPNAAVVHVQDRTPPRVCL